MLSYEILITSESSNIQKEFKKYVRKIDKNWKRLNVPIDNFNHAIDACRYISLMKLMNKNKKRKIKILIPNL
jgi:phage terminase large subunit